MGATYSLSAQESINVMTYNIRLNVESDGEHAWPHRKADVISVLRFHKADIFCLQEVVHNQMEDVTAAFQDFEYVGVGRDDGISAGEYSPVFYRKSRFKELDSGNFWLSTTPDKPSLGWDAACIRICSWAKLEDTSTGKQMFVLNTHFDHVGVTARKNAAALILKKIDEVVQDKPVVLCGDFNLPPESIPIQKISTKLKDSYHATVLPPHGSEATFLGFTYDNGTKSRIDYVFVSADVKVKRYGALSNQINQLIYADKILKEGLVEA